MSKAFNLASYDDVMTHASTAAAARPNRVSDIKRYYDLWSSRGAKFITEPKVHATELRCYMRDPDGYLIEVGQTTMTAGPLDLYA
jgi:hypothetical protein